MSESTWEGANDAWKYLDRAVDLGAFGSIAAVVAQPRVGPCTLEGNRPGSRRRGYSCAPRANLNLVAIVLEQARRLQL